MFVCTIEQCRSLVYWKGLYFDSMPFTCLETVMASSFRQRQNTWFWPSKFEYSIFVLSYHNSHLYKNWNIISKFFLWILSCFKLLSTIWIMPRTNQYISFFNFQYNRIMLHHHDFNIKSTGKKIGLLFYFDIESNHSVLLFIIGLIFKKRFIHNEFQGSGMGVIKLLLMMKYVSITWYYFWVFLYIFLLYSF